MKIVYKLFEYFFLYFRYPPLMKLEEGEKAGTLYSFKGTKLLNKVENSLKTKLKLQYEVFVRVVEETEL